jgi:hypothetical protein
MRWPQRVQRSGSTWWTFGGTLHLQSQTAHSPASWSRRSAGGRDALERYQLAENPRPTPLPCGSLAERTFK